MRSPRGRQRSAYELAPTHEGAYVVVENDADAATLDEALGKAITEANAHSDWASAEVSGNTFIDAVAEGDDIDLWDDATKQLPVPACFTEEGEGPRVIVIVAQGAVEAVSIQNGYARVEVRDYDCHDTGGAAIRTDPEGRRYAFSDWSNVIPAPDDPAG